MLKIVSYQAPTPRLVQRFAAAGLPRAIQHMLQGKFAIFTASRGEFSPEENKQRVNALKKDLRDLGFGFMKTFGAWRESDIQSGIKKWISEDSMFVPGISEEETAELCKKYSQEAYVWGNDGTYWIKTPEGQVYQAGPVAEHFRIVSEENPADIYTGFKKDPRQFIFDPERVKKPPQIGLEPESVPGLGEQQRIASRVHPYYFYSLEGEPKYVARRSGVKEWSDNTPDVTLCDAWIPLRERR